MPVAGLVAVVDAGGRGKRRRNAKDEQEEGKGGGCMPRRCPPPELSTYWRQGTHIILITAAIWESRRHKLCRVFTRPGTTTARSVAADAGQHVAMGLATTPFLWLSLLMGWLLGAEIHFVLIFGLAGIFGIFQSFCWREFSTGPAGSSRPAGLRNGKLALELKSNQYCASAGGGLHAHQWWRKRPR